MSLTAWCLVNLPDARLYIYTGINRGAMHSDKYVTHRDQVLGTKQPLLGLPCRPGEGHRRQLAKPITGVIIYYYNYNLLLLQNKRIRQRSFNGHFPGQSGLAGARMSPFWTLLELRLIRGGQVVVTTGVVRPAKLQSHRRSQHTITQTFLQAGCPSCRPTNSV